MYLLAILLAYSLERTVQLGRNWEWRRLVLRWQHLQISQDKVEEWRQHRLGRVLWAILPALIIWFVLALFGNTLLTFVVSAAALFLAIRVPAARTAYRNYLDAATSGDEEGAQAALHKLQKLADRHEEASVENVLLWIHLRYYFAVFVYFLLFGVVGALVYATLRDMRHPHNERWSTAEQVIDWLPTRIMTLGFLLVGNFSRAAPLWLSSIGNVPQGNYAAATKIAAAAEDLTPKHEDDITSTALTTVALVKRNMLLFIVLLAVLTIGGWL